MDQVIAPQPPQDKSVGVAVVLTLLFGPLGMFYVAKWYEALIITAATVFFGVVTLGLALIIIAPGTVIWAAVLAGNRHGEFQTYLATIGPASQPQLNP